MSSTTDPAGGYTAGPRQPPPGGRRLVVLAALLAGLLLSAPVLAQTYTYDSLGRLVMVTRADGVTTTYTYDPADNRTSRITTSTPPPPPPLSVSVAPASLYGTGYNLTDPATATVTGGVPPYTYSWQRLSGSTNILANDPTAAETPFYWDGPLSGPPKLSTWRCTVTDSASTVVNSSNVQVTFDPSG